MIKSILVGLDGSAPSMTGLDEAAFWAGRLDAELRGLFVEDEQRFLHYPAGFSADGGIPISAPLSDEDMAAENEKVREEGEKIRAAFEAKLKSASRRGQYLSERGNVNHLLTRHARGAGLLVLGRRGRNDPPDSKGAGPTTETLIHNALRPTLVVPDNPPHRVSARGKGPVLFAYDGGKGSHRVIIPGTELAAANREADSSANGKPASVVCIGDDEALRMESEQILSKYWAPHGIEAIFHFARKEDRISSMIAEFARRDGASLIAMGAFGHNPLHELFFGSTTLETIAQAEVPVLLMA